MKCKISQFRRINPKSYEQFFFEKRPISINLYENERIFTRPGRPQDIPHGGVEGKVGVALQGVQEWNSVGGVRHMQKKRFLSCLIFLASLDSNSFLAFFIETLACHLSWTMPVALIIGRQRRQGRQGRRSIYPDRLGLGLGLVLGLGFTLRLGLNFTSGPVT